MSTDDPNSTGAPRVNGYPVPPAGGKTVQGIVDPVENTGTPPEEKFPFPGEAEPAALAVHQIKPQIRLQFSDGMAHGRLAQAQPLCTPGVAFNFCQGVEGFQLVQIHLHRGPLKHLARNGHINNPLHHQGHEDHE
jgi:hypothetical protein